MTMYTSSFKRVVIKPTRRVNRIATSALTREAKLCHCIVHTRLNSTDPAHHLNCKTFVLSQCSVVYNIVLRWCKPARAVRWSNYKSYVITRIFIVLLSCPHLSQINRNCKLVNLQQSYCRAQRYCIDLISMRVSNWPTLRVRQFSKNVLTRNATLFYSAIYMCRKSTDAARQSPCIT